MPFHWPDCEAERLMTFKFLDPSWSHWEWTGKFAVGGIQHCARDGCLSQCTSTTDQPSERYGHSPAVIQGSSILAVRQSGGNWWPQHALSVC